MRIPRRLLSVILVMAATLSCAGSGSATSTPSKKSRSAKTADDAGDLRKTQQQVQSQLMSFTDRFFAATFQAAWELQEALPTPQARQDAGLLLPQRPAPVGDRLAGDAERRRGVVDR